MTFVDNKLVCVADHFPLFGTYGTRLLMFRDIPDLIKCYASGSIALDYGCGTGTSTRILTSCGFNAEGVDIDETIMETAKQLDPDGQYMVIQSGKIPVGDNHYDLIYTSMVFPYVSTKTEIHMIFKEFSRCLKKDGILIVAAPNENTYQYEWWSQDGRFEENKNANSGSIVRILVKPEECVFLNYYWTKEDYLEAFASSGFNILEIRRPLGADTDGFEWVNENKVPYCDIYVARKP